MTKPNRSGHDRCMPEPKERPPHRPHSTRIVIICAIALIVGYAGVLWETCHRRNEVSRDVAR